jgi:mRNA (guanine-N7-)-methyltransferase
MQVEQCYTDLRRGTEEDRANSSLVGIRSCNNFVKAVAFTRFVPKEYPVRVLDWACGKGGDFFKFTQIFPSMEAYTGIDVTRKSIDDFIARVDRKLPAGLEFSLDVQDLRTFVPHVHIPFYVVSCQFAFHYFCETLESMQSVLQRMASVLAVGGRIIITTPQPDQLLARLRPIGPSGRKELRIINPDTLELKCRVVTVPTERAYFFELLDGDSFAVRAPEFFVHKDVLERAARSAGLQIVFQQNMLRFLEESRATFETLAHAFKLPSALRPDDREIIELYQVLVLEKTPVIQLAPSLSFF